MRVAVDARPAAFPERTGIGTYVWYLLRDLPRADPATTYLAWYLDVRRLAGGPSPLRELRAPNLVHRAVPIPARWFAAASGRFDLPRVEWFGRFDVLLAPNFLPPPTRARRLVITVHDLAFRLQPDTAPETTRRWLDGMDRAAARATRVITPSECTRRDVLDAYGMDPDRVVVVPHGVDHAVYRPASGDADPARAVRERFGIEGPYLLYLGGIEPRKNLPRLVEAFAALPGDHRPALVLAGSGVRWNPEGTTALHRVLAGLPAAVRDRIAMTGYVGLPGKLELLQGAMALVNPTLYEGFGLQLVEAMACGTPVLASNGSAVPEVTGEAALLVDPTDPAAILEGLERLVTDDAVRRRLRDAGVERAAAFDWRHTAELTARVLHEAAEA